MLLTPRIERLDGHVAVRFSGAGTLAEAGTMLQMLRHATIEFADTRLLIDLREVDECFSEVEEMELGRMCGIAFAHLHKVASLVRTGRRTGRSERSADGFNLKVFVSEQDALAWLLQSAR